MGGPRLCALIGRLVRSADFERVLRTATRASTAHFAVHHLIDSPSLPAKPKLVVSIGKLSTDGAPVAVRSVDESSETCVNASVAGSASSGLGGLWLGAVVPKRHARRSVTRTLLKRQIRATVSRQGGSLARGLWVVRLRAPFDRAQFASAASDELQSAARAELESLLASAMARAGRR